MLHYALFLILVQQVLDFYQQSPVPSQVDLGDQSGSIKQLTYHKFLDKIVPDALVDYHLLVAYGILLCLFLYTLAHDMETTVILIFGVLYVLSPSVYTVVGVGYHYVLGACFSLEVLRNYIEINRTTRGYDPSKRVLARYASEWFVLTGMAAMFAGPPFVVILYIPLIAALFKKYDPCPVKVTQFVLLTSTFGSWVMMLIEFLVTGSHRFPLLEYYRFHLDGFWLDLKSGNLSFRTDLLHLIGHLFVQWRFALLMVPMAYWIPCRTPYRQMGQKLIQSFLLLFLSTALLLRQNTLALWPAYPFLALGVALKFDKLPWKCSIPLICLCAFLNWSSFQSPGSPLEDSGL